MLVEVQDVSVVLPNPGNCTILSKIECTLRIGDCVAIVGPNGAGKSTLLRVLAGLCTPSSGDVLLEGTPLHSTTRAVIAKRIGYVPQRLGELPQFTVEEFLALSSNGPHYSNEGLVADIVPTELLPRTLTTLSGGELQRVMLGGVIAQDAQLLLLDEPTNNLDPAVSLEFEDMLEKLKKSGRFTIVMVTHDLNLALRSMTSFILLSKGELVWRGSADDPSLPSALSAAFEVAFEQLSSSHGGRMLVPIKKV